MRKKGEQVYEGKVLCANGEMREFQFNKAAITNDRGVVIGIIGVMTDITERNQSQRLLEKETKRYKSFYLSSDVGIYQTTVDGKIIRANPAFLKIFGYQSLKEIKNISTRDLYVDPSDRTNLLRTLKTDGMTTRSLVLRRNDKSEIKVQAMAKLSGDIITGYLSEIKSPRDGLLIAMCASCFKIREGKDSDDWISPSDFLIKHKNEIKNPDIDYGFSHAICPTCGRELYGNLFPGDEEA